MLFLISGARTVVNNPVSVWFLPVCISGNEKDMIGRKFVYRFVVITMYLSAGLVPIT